MLSEELVDIVTRHQVYLERLKSGEVRKCNAIWIKLDKKLSDELARLQTINLTEVSFAARLRLQTNITAATEESYQERLVSLIAMLKDLSEFEREFETQAIDEVTIDAVEPVEQPEEDGFWSAITGWPLSGAGGMLLGAFLGKWVGHESQRTEGLIRRAFAEGWTRDMLYTAFRGTKEADYSDGLFASARRNTAAVIETAIQHISTAARNIVQRNIVILPRGAKISRDIKIDENGVVRKIAKRVLDMANRGGIRVGMNVKLKGYRWISILDKKTSQICRSLDQLVFKFGLGPIPPAHMRCRSSIIAEILGRWQRRDSAGRFIKKDERNAQGANGNEAVDGTESYYGWLKRQPADFQDDALGPTRGKLFREGGMSAESFARLNIGRHFEPLTLDEMRQLAPRAFKRAGI